MQQKKAKKVNQYGYTMVRIYSVKDGIYQPIMERLDKGYKIISALAGNDFTEYILEKVSEGSYLSPDSEDYTLGRKHGYEAGLKDGESREFWKIYRTLDQDGESSVIRYIRERGGDFNI